MKRKQLIKHLHDHGCELLREGGKHSVFVNRATQKVTTVPRHTELNEYLVKKVCKDLEIPLI